MGRKRVGSTIVDTETGEIVARDKAKRFSKIMQEVWRNMAKQSYLTAAEERLLFRLSLYLQLNTNAIVNPDNSTMSVEDMAKETNVDRSNIRKYLKQLVQKNALGIFKNGFTETYYMNPYLFQKGEIEPLLFAQFNQEYESKVKYIEDANRFKAGRTVTTLISTG